MTAKHWRILCPLLILLAGICAYHNSLRGPFVFDDYAAILQNPEVRSATESLLPKTEYTAGRAAAVFTFHLNYLAGGFDPVGYHLANLAVHLLTALVLFGLVRRTLLSPKLADEFRQYASPLALMSALLFVTHPLTTEVVNYILQRTESLMALMALLTLYFLNRGLSSSRPTGPFVLSILTCAIGMGCKQVMVVVPLIAVAYDRTFFAESWAEVIRRRWAFYLGLFATWVVLIGLQLLRPKYESVGATSAGITPWVYLLTESTVLLHYLWLTIWPHPLVIDYFDWRPAWSLAKVWPQGLIVLVILGITLRAFWKDKPAGFVGLAIFLALAPTSSILPMPSEYIAERRMYLPLAFFLPMIVVAGFVLVRRGIGSSVLGPLIGAAVVVVFLALCIARNRDYESEETLWSVTVTSRPLNARAWANYGDVCYRHNKQSDAVIACRTAIQLDTSMPGPHQCLGTILAKSGDYPGAIREFLAAVLYHDDAKSRALLANAYAHLGRYDEALAEFRRAMRMNPNDPALHDACGFVLAQMGRTREAAVEFARAVGIDPAMTGAYFDLALAQEAEGDWKSAVANLRTALSRDPEKPLLLRSLAWALAVAPDSAVVNAQEAVGLAKKCDEAKGGDAETLDTLAAAYARAGKFEDAIAAAARAAGAADDSHRANLAGVIRARLRMYQKHQPFIQPMPATRSTTQSAL